jgi:hypothetical protein
MDEQEEQIMVAKIMMALGLIATMAAATAPAHAYYLRDCLRGAPCPGGVGVDRPAYRDRDDRYRDYNYVPRDRYRSRGCRTVTIERDDGSIRTIRRCD